MGPRPSALGLLTGFLEARAAYEAATPRTPLSGRGPRAVGRGPRAASRASPPPHREEARRRAALARGVAGARGRLRLRRRARLPDGRLPHGGVDPRARPRGDERAHARDARER